MQNQTLWQQLQQIPREDWPQYIKKNHQDLWLDMAWSKVNLWRGNQQKQSSVLGDTPDYERTLFTLDDRATKMVNFAFKKYWEDGLVYKGSYLVNWSVGLQTAVSDVAGEIEYEKRVDPFVTFEYRFEDFDIYFQSEMNNNSFDKVIEAIKPKLRDFFDSNPIFVSTVRPETIFGDVALAVHPNIFRNKLIESDKFTDAEINIIIEFLNNFSKRMIVNTLVVRLRIYSLKISNIKLILSEEVDPNFGTGALKITPASDQHDYDIFNKYLGGTFPHSIGRDGKLTEVCGDGYRGLTVEQGRLAVIKRLAETGYIPVKENTQTPSALRAPSSKEGQGEFQNDSNLSEENYEDFRKRILAEVKANLESESFNPTDYSYTEGQKRLREIMGEAGKMLQIDWNYEHNVTICERTKTVIEPLISEEFFLSYHVGISHKVPPNPLDLFLKGKSSLLEKVPPNPLDRGSLAHDISLKLANSEAVSKNSRFKINPKLIPRAKEMAENLTKAEQIVWDEILKSKQTEYKFIRQQIIDNYIVDFYCSEFLLAIEIDGDSHDEKQQYDTVRTNLLNTFGIEVIRFTNEQVYNDLDNVKNTILDIIKNKVENKLGYSPYLGGKGVPNHIDKENNCQKEVLKQDTHTLQSIGIEAINETTFYPAEIKDRAINFLENIKDWCISRDMIWGHKMPVWYNLDLNPNKVFYSYKDWQKDEKVRSAFQISPQKPALPGDWVQEEKILDTWFSSCLWPLSTLDYVEYAEGTPNTDFETYYLSTDMVTGVDILYTWIIRMSMLGKYFTGKIPYKNVIITPTVRDEQGRKMSKSLGNGLDPVTQIDKYSSDSLRLAMLSGMIPARNFRLGGKIADKMSEKYRNFGNKLWNVARFLEGR